VGIRSAVDRGVVAWKGMTFTHGKKGHGAARSMRSKKFQLRSVLGKMKKVGSKKKTRA